MFILLSYKFEMSPQCASLVAQLVRNLPAMRETWVQSLGWEHPLKKLYVSGNKIQMTVWDILTEIKNTLLAF